MVAGALLVTAMPANAQNRRANDRVADQLNAQVLEVLRAGQRPVAAPATPVVSAPAVTVTAAREPRMYVGGTLGSNFRDATEYQVGGVLGYQFNRNWAAELTYDYAQLNNRTDGQMVMGNVVYGREIAQSGFTPYALVGAGIGWNAVLGARDTGSNPALYNVGGGVRYSVTPRVDLDARYRYVGAFNDNVHGNSNVVTAGMNFRF